jgi:flagellin-like hook-associated protein FlgL
LFEFKNILDATYGAHVVNRVYAGVSVSNGDLSKKPSRGQAIATIREFLAGNTAVVRQSARDASTAVSTIQIFTDAIETIAEKLAKLLELARKALGSDYSQPQEIQRRLRELIREINQIVNSTEYKFNKPFSSSGKTLPIPLGNGSKIDIFTRDFRLNTQDFDIETNPQNALSTIKDAITNINEFKTYLDRQASNLRDITAAIEMKIQGAMSVNMQNFQPELAAPMADYAASLILQDKQTSINTQANLTPDEILKLLKNNN